MLRNLDPSDFLTSSLSRYPTRGPAHRFNAVLFPEKEGFNPLLAAAKIAERYDIAIMSTKGMPVVASRHLADELCGKHGIPLLLLHDFDKSGFSIFGTLAGNNIDPDEFNRYEFRHDFEVIDLGLRLADVQEYDLESEPVAYQSDPTENLADNGATLEEIAFLRGTRAPHGDGYHGRRVELNAFTSGDFIKWLEGKLVEHGIEKVVPDSEILEAAYRRALQIALVQEQLPAIIARAGEQAAAAELPDDLEQLVQDGLDDDPAQSWDDVLADAAQEDCKYRYGDDASGEQAESVAQDGNLTKGGTDHA